MLHKTIYQGVTLPLHLKSGRSSFCLSIPPFDHSSGRPFIWSCCFATDSADD